MKKIQTLESETFGNGKRNYFIDFNRAANNSNYIQISRSDLQPDGSHRRSSVCIFEEDFTFLIESFSMLFTNVIYKKEKASALAEARVKGIKSWEPDLRPREKFLKLGADALSDAELLAMLIGSGTPDVTAVDLAAKILKSVGDDLQALSRITVAQLKKFHGIGNARALSVVSALELSRRKSKSVEALFQLRLAK
jgi:DNA repair protein RadC